MFNKLILKNDNVIITSSDRRFLEISGFFNYDKEITKYWLLTNCNIKYNFFSRTGYFIEAKINFDNCFELTNNELRKLKINLFVL